MSFTQLWTHFKLDNVFQNGVIIDIRLVLSAIDLVCDLQAEEKTHFFAFLYNHVQMNGKEKDLFSLNKVKFASFLQNSIWSPEKKRKTKVTFVLGSLEIERGRAKNEHV